MRVKSRRNKKTVNIGKRRRLSRILRHDGRSVIVPMDHGVTLGPVTGLVNMQAIVDKLKLGNADAIIVHKGIAQHIDTTSLGLIVHLSASTSLGPDPNWKVQVCSVEQAMKLGADGVSIHVNLGAPKEPEMLADMGRIANECETFDIPLLAMIYPRGPKIESQHDVKYVKHAARLGAELGADLIKTNYTGSRETFREVVDGCPVPVIIAGGPKAKTTKEVLEVVYDSIHAGGAGVSIGRNTFQHRDSTAMVKALSVIVHEGATVRDALRILGENG